MKIFLTVLMALCISLIINAQVLELPFFDDFEEQISNDGSFTNWTTENLEGWQYWHIVPGQHMRFENNDLDQNDWLITKKINCAGAENLKVNFSYLYNANKVPPHLYYTNQYNGNASQSTWTELSFSFEENKDQWYSSEEYIIENPGDAIYFAFHYQAAANEGAYFLLDNFSVRRYTPPVQFIKTDSTEHFEYYTNFTDSLEFSSGIRENIEKQFEKLASIWEKPQSNIKIYEKKIKVYYSDINDIDLFDGETPDWKAGFYDANNYCIYLSPIDNEKKSSIYSNINLLAISELSQLFLTIYNGLSYSQYVESNFIESFGLYESGLRPSRNKISVALQKLGHTPNLDDIRGLDKLIDETQRELCLSYVEACILGKSTENIGIWKEELWQNHLYYFYKIDEDKAIRLSKQSDHFNIYCIPRDDEYVDAIAEHLESHFQRITQLLELDIKHPINVLIYPDEETGVAFTNNEGYNGGVGEGTDNFNMLSPGFVGDGIQAFLTSGIIGHEFSHVIHFNFISVNWIPYYRFYMEGFADFMPDENFDITKSMSFYQIRLLFSGFKNSYHRDPTLGEILENNFQEDTNIGEINCYLFGSIFYDYLIKNKVADYLDIKAFFAGGADWNVFQNSYEEIDAGYISYLKSLAGITDAVKIEEVQLKIFIESDYLAIQNAENLQNAELKIFTLTGQKLLQKNVRIYPNEKYSLQLPGAMKSEFFILQIKSENSVITKKLYNSGY